MGMIYFSKKVQVEPVYNYAVWAARGWFDFIPYKSWQVPFDGNWLGIPHRKIRRMVVAMEQRENPDAEILDAYVAVGSDYILITVGTFAT